MPVTSEEEDEDEDVTLHSEEDASHSEVSTSDYEDDDELPPRQPFSQHTFAPPFYGRPPTPLPPSPSLTSLLRPSRPTTPDASDDDAEQQPVPRASPQVPTYEYYGFVLYLLSSLGFLIYLLWSYLPSPFLHALGIYYYPNRWWSLAIPSFLVVLFVYIYVALAAYNTEVLTLPLSSIETVVDDAAQIAVLDSRGRIRDDEKRKTDRRRAERESRRQQQQGQKGQRRGGRDDGDHNGSGRRGEQERDLLTPAGGLNWREVWNEGTDAVMDIPLAGVCEVVYGEGRDMSDEDDDDGGMITRL
ncbi:PIG-P-domain-containing protein [Lasiosphaeria miniovina]|uniref:PIG-P-domain-containing protein n=1 Tax=Lasiosphaeria miniovina TaxID=1954250 RepID=A0AA40BIW9_9PEZI|nr:PIG-P-domain-containing protein [Lasiosphaeria miniovina]KAK0735039.1 PIG-P-domain-containing protein [Lasiosphaeria miniovina]